jgi:hypothetical protein
MTEDYLNDTERAFTPEERAALDAWRVPRAPAGFAARAVRRASMSTQARWPRLVNAAAALTLVVGAAAWLSTFVTIPRTGAWTGKARSSIDVGGRATAVAEPLSRGTWSVSAAGEALVEQERGRVFYRVEPGGGFVVETPAGRIQVTGTCFRLEVTQMDRTNIKSGAVGAAIAAVAVVTVYEGQVVASTLAGEKVVNPGEEATLDQHGVWVTPESSEMRVAATGRPLSGPTQAGASASPELNDEDGAESPTYAALVRERSALRDRVRSLQDQVRELEKKTRANRTYGLTDEELSAMAEQCEVRWDWMAPDTANPQTISDTEAEKLGLSDEQRAALDEAIKVYGAGLSEELRALYVALTGEPNPGSMSAQAMFSEAMDKTPREETRRVFYTVAHERAGLLPPVADWSSLPPFERLFRQIHGAGDRLEGEMARAVGAELAGEVRALHGGFGSKHRLRNGCPGSED